MNDISQYPVFPWVLQDFSSDELDLTNERVFRDLRRPVGALDEDRLDHYRQKYYEIVRSDPDEHSQKPFMYSTHYSSSGITLYYLIRLFPAYILRLQTGGFGPADLSRSSIRRK